MIDDNEGKSEVISKEFLKFVTKSTKQQVIARKLLEEEKSLELQGNSLIFFRQNNRFRNFLKNIVINSIFEMIIFASVIGSAICMMLEQPLSDPNSSFNHILG